MYATGIAAFGLAAFPVFAVFDTRNIAWFAVGMIVAFGVIHAWFYAPQGTLYASLFPTRVRYTGLSTVYQLSGVYASGIHAPDTHRADCGRSRRALVRMHVSCDDGGDQFGRDGAAQAERVGNVTDLHLGIGPADVLWSSCDCSDR
jgi:hypothetical protein